MGHKAPIETFDPEGRGLDTTWAASTRRFMSLAVHCRSRSRRLQLRSPIVAKALAALAASHPHRLGGFSYVAIKTGETTTPQGGISMPLSSSCYFGLLGIF